MSAPRRVMRSTVLAVPADGKAGWLLRPGGSVRGDSGGAGPGMPAWVPGWHCARIASCVLTGFTRLALPSYRAG